MAPRLGRVLWWLGLTLGVGCFLGMWLLSTPSLSTKGARAKMMW
jgi:hypothetical protein